jgi:hypothetical protein
MAALAVSAAAASWLVGCGNGVEVGGPAAPASTVAVSPASPTSATPSEPDSPASSPSAKKTAPSGKSTKDSGSGKSKGAGSDDNTGSGNSGGGTSKRGDSGGANAVTKCGLGDLNIGVRVPVGGGAAGSQYVLLTFTNKSSQACTIYGYAGVSFVGHQDGTQLGKPAVRDRSRAPATVRLASGSTKSELLQIADAGNFDPKQCQPTTSDGFRVYPPDSYTAAYVPFKTAACQGKVAQLRVYPVGIKP